MKLLLTTIAVVLLVGCGESQQQSPSGPQRVINVQPPDVSIHDAAEKGDVETVKQHLEAGTNVNAKNKKWGFTPLHIAANGIPRQKRGFKKLAEFLIANGANVNAKSDYGSTPLMEAASLGYNNIVQLLITAGADVNAKDAGVGPDDPDGLDPRPGETALDTAIKNSQHKTAGLLRKHGGKKGKELRGR